MDIASVVSGGFNARDATTPGAATPPAPSPMAARLQGCANCPELPSPLLTLPPELLRLIFAKLDLGSLLAVSQAHPHLRAPARQACRRYRHERLPEVIAALIDQHGLPLLRFCQRSGLNINPGDEPDVGIRRLMTLLMYNGEDDLLATLLATPGADTCARLRGANSDTLLLELLDCLPPLTNSILALLAHPQQDVNAPDRSGETPLMKVMRLGHLPLAQALLARPELTTANAADNQGRTMLIQAALQGDSALMSAAAQGHVSVVTTLVQDGRQCVNQVNREGLSALWLAVTADHVLTVEVLLKHPAIAIAAPNARGYCVLQQAVIDGQYRMVNALLAHPHMPVAQRDARGCTLLHLAARYGRSLVIRILLTRTRLDRNSRDHQGQTALGLAAAGDHTSALTALLPCPQSELNARDNLGRTALLLAAPSTPCDSCLP